MPELKRCFEAAGFSDVRTLLSSGNVAFDARASALASLEDRAERSMRAELGRTFGTTVRAATYLQALVGAEPFAGFDLPPTAKRVATFLRRADRRRRAGPTTLLQAGRPVDSTPLRSSYGWEPRWHTERHSRQQPSSKEMQA
jgi:hypothetical protein